MRYLRNARNVLAACGWLLAVSVGGRQCLADPPRGIAAETAKLIADAEPAEQFGGDFPPLIVDPDSDSGESAAEGDGVFAPIVTTGSALLVVLALFGVFVAASRRWGPSRPIVGGVPEDVVQHLGSTPLDAKTRVTFLKIGQRLLVIGQTQSGDPQTLSEITDPDEVERLSHRLLGRPEIVGKRSPSTSGMGIRRSKMAAG